MHPVEHFLYYSCAWFPFLFKCHPLHFLYAKFHADIAPIGGHDGFDDPGKRIFVSPYVRGVAVVLSVLLTHQDAWNNRRKW